MQFSGASQQPFIDNSMNSGHLYNSGTALQNQLNDRSFHQQYSDNNNNNLMSAQTMQGLNNSEANMRKLQQPQGVNIVTSNARTPITATVESTNRKRKLKAPGSKKYTVTSKLMAQLNTNQIYNFGTDSKQIPFKSVSRTTKMQDHKRQMEQIQSDMKSVTSRMKMNSALDQKTDKFNLSSNKILTYI